MDIAPFVYAVVTLTIFIALMRMRKVAMRKEPRIHRSTYKAVKY